MLRSLVAASVATVGFLFNVQEVTAHAHMTFPAPRQPEPVYWYSVGCAIGCNCTGDGKEMYPNAYDLCTPIGEIHN